MAPDMVGELARRQCLDGQSIQIAATAALGDEFVTGRTIWGLL